MKNMNNTVRLQTIELQNFKNTTNGQIVFESYEKKCYLRDYYLREILLGEQTKKIYYDTNSASIT